MLVINNKMVCYDCFHSATANALQTQLVVGGGFYHNICTSNFTSTAYESHSKVVIYIAKYPNGSTIFTDISISESEIVRVRKYFAI